ECSVMDERVKFVARRLAGEPMADLCREFGISRKTGYKIFDRYQECGIHGLTDRSRRPYRYANQLPFQVENFILNARKSVRPKSVTYVLGTLCNPCIRAGPSEPGGREGIRTPGLLVANEALSQLSYSPTSSILILAKTPVLANTG